jgi:PII-like signaling protein
MTWGAVIPTLLPSAGWEAELMPLGNNVDIVTIIADAPSKIYRIRPYITPRYDDTLKVTFDRTDTFTMDSE